MAPSELAKLLETVQSSGYYTLEHIPKDKLRTAINLYPVDLGDTPVALVDSTVFGSAKTGMVVGLKGVYWRNDRMNRANRSFVSWVELAEGDNAVYRKGADIHLQHGCEFGMAGSSMDKDVLVNLLNRIIELHRQVGTFDVSQAGAKKTESSDGESGTPQEDSTDESTIQYQEVTLDLMVMCMTADGKVEDPEVELATEMIDADDFIEDKAKALDALLSRLEADAESWRKSQALVRLKATTLAARAAKLDQDSKERLVIMLEGILSSVEREEGSTAAALFELVQGKLA